MEYDVECIGTKLFDFSGVGGGGMVGVSVSDFVLCLFSFERGSLYEWQDFIVRQKITTIVLIACLPPTGYVITDRKWASWTDLGSANLARKAWQ